MTEEQDYTMAAAEKAASGRDRHVSVWTAGYMGVYY